MRELWPKVFQVLLPQPKKKAETPNKINLQEIKNIFFLNKNQLNKNILRMCTYEI